MERKKELLIRVYLIFFGFVLLAGFIIGKVFKTAILEGEQWRAKGEKTMKWMNVEGERGNIYDLNGNLLATSLPYFDIKVDLLTPTDKLFNEHIEALSIKLAEHFGKSKQDWATTLINKRREGKAVEKRRKNGEEVYSNAGYFPLLDKQSKDKLDLLKSFPLFNLGKYKGGLIAIRKTRREKPYRSLASRTIGIEREERMVGLERTFDKFLQGETSKRLMRKVPPNETWLPVMEASEMLQEKGSDIVTTIDMNIQDIVHEELLTTLETSKAKGGVAIVMEVETGAIRAICNLSLMGDDPQYREYHNDAIGTATEPGSTFKLLTAMMMLEEGKVDLDTKVELFGGKKRFYKSDMYDSHRHGIVTATFKEAFAMSSNVGIGYGAFKHYGTKREGWTNFYNSMKQLGVMESTGVEIYGEKKPFIKHPKKVYSQPAKNWSGTTVPWMAHGYELKMTPLQILNYYNAIANDGKMMRPHLVSEIVHMDESRTMYGPKVIKEQIVSASTVMKTQELLKAVAESGTARKLKVDGLTFAGKTGTTKLEYWKPKDKYDYNASFAGYFPEENPKYSMMVVVYEPEGVNYYGANVAGPVFRNVMKRLSTSTKVVDNDSSDDYPEVLYAHSGFKSDYKKVLDFIGMDYEVSGKGKWIEMKSGRGEMKLVSKSIDKNLVPDVRGEGLRDAFYILENMGFEVEASGYGKVVKQSVAPGTAIREKKIKIYLS